MKRSPLKVSHRTANSTSLTRVYRAMREVILQEFPRAVTVKQFLSNQGESEGLGAVRVFTKLKRGRYPVFTITLNPRVVYVVPKEENERAR